MTIEMQANENGEFVVPQAEKERAAEVYERRAKVKRAVRK